MKRGKLFLAVAGVAVLAGVAGRVSATQEESFVSRLLRLSRSRTQQGTLKASIADTQVGAVNPSGVVVAVMGSDSFGDGIMGVLDNAGIPRAGVGVGSEGAGQVHALSTSGLNEFFIDGNLGFVSGPADIAERFQTVGAETPKGAVLMIDPDHRGALRVADKPYDPRVAGVVAGANDFRPGMTLGNRRQGPNTVSVTLSGTVYCLATSSNGRIRA